MYPLDGGGVGMVGDDIVSPACEGSHTRTSDGVPELSVRGRYPMEVGIEPADSEWTQTHAPVEAEPPAAAGEGTAAAGGAAPA